MWRAGKQPLRIVSPFKFLTAVKVVYSYNITGIFVGLGVVYRRIISVRAS